MTAMSKAEQKPKKVYGMLAEYGNPAKLIRAAKLVNRAGYQKYDAYSPFPIHGMDEAMGLKESKLGYIVLVHAIMGFFGALALQIWTSSIAYPINISGKPFMNIPAFIPVTFELTVLLSAFGAVFGMFFMNNMPRHNNPLFNSRRFEKVTDDGFFICIEANDDFFDEDKTRKLLQDAGATHIEHIYTLEDR
jgi:hypothetical protein